MAGDVSFSGRLRDRGATALLPIAAALQRADLSFVNLETPLIAEPGGRLFAGPLEAATWLSEAGVTVANVANNHMLDFGTDGLGSTVDALAAAGIKAVGTADGPAHHIFDLAGLRVAILASARTLKPLPGGIREYDAQRLIEDVRQARAAAEVVVVSLHLGYMFMDVPHPGQRGEILALLSAGADLVVAHHPHVLQGVEIHDGRVACYSLGNLLFDIEEGGIEVQQMIHEQTHGGIFFFGVDPAGVHQASLRGTHITEDLSVTWGDSGQGETSVERVRRLSADLLDPGDLARQFDRQMSERLSAHVVRSAFLEFFQTGWRHPWKFLRRIRLRHLSMLLRRAWRPRSR